MASTIAPGCVKHRLRLPMLQRMHSFAVPAYLPPSPISSNAMKGKFANLASLWSQNLRDPLLVSLETIKSSPPAVCKPGVLLFQELGKVVGSPWLTPRIRSGPNALALLASTNNESIQRHIAFKLQQSYWMTSLPTSFACAQMYPCFKSCPCSYTACSGSRALTPSC